MIKCLLASLYCRLLWHIAGAKSLRTEILLLMFFFKMLKTLNYSKLKQWKRNIQYSRIVSHCLNLSKFVTFVTPLYKISDILWDLSLLLSNVFKQHSHGFALTQDFHNQVQLCSIIGFYTKLVSPCQLECELLLQQKGDIPNTKKFPNSYKIF